LAPFNDALHDSRSPTQNVKKYTFFSLLKNPFWLFQLILTLGKIEEISLHLVWAPRTYDNKSPVIDLTPNFRQDEVYVAIPSVAYPKGRLDKKIKDFLQ
jgi:hypothetical protein